MIDGVVSHPNGDFFFCPTGGCPGNCQFDCDLCMSCTPIGSGPLDDSAWRTARACARGACARGARACRSYMNWNTSLNISKLYSTGDEGDETLVAAVGYRDHRGLHSQICWGARRAVPVGGSPHPTPPSPGNNSRCLQSLPTGLLGWQSPAQARSPNCAFTSWFTRDPGFSR